MNRIRILAVDDEPEWLAIIQDLIARQPDLKLVQTAGNLAEAIDIIEQQDIDVVIQDLYLTDDKYDGILAIEALLNIKPVKIIVLTSFKDQELVLAAFKAGAVNYINKQYIREIPDRIRDTYRNDSRLEDLLAEFRRMAEELRLQVLSPMERKVYDLRKQGYTYRQIEAELQIETRTIKNHINHILKKLKQ
jgi:NarL family two-component system response regulator LiaR